MKTIREYLAELTFHFDLDPMDYYQDGQTFDEFNESILKGINQQEIIYYSEAIKYLQLEDSSLRNSLDMADELGYNLGSLNSEILATLIYQQRLREQWTDCYSEIEDYFEVYNEYLEGLEEQSC